MSTLRKINCGKFSIDIIKNNILFYNSFARKYYKIEINTNKTPQKNKCMENVINEQMRSRCLVFRDGSILTLIRK